VENEDFNITKARLIERGNQFADTATRARVAIAEVGSRFITHNSTVLVHGYSRVVSALMQRAVLQGAHFSVIVTEGRLEEAGLQWTKELAPMGVPVSVVLDSAVAYHMDRCVINATALMGSMSSWSTLCPSLSAVTQCGSRHWLHDTQKRANQSNRRNPTRKCRQPEVPDMCCMLKLPTLSPLTVHCTV
jgi:hypothetical protein